MKTLIRKLGNSAGAIIPAEALKSIGVKVGDIVEVDVIDGAVTIKPPSSSHCTAVSTALIDLEKEWASG